MCLGQELWIRGWLTNSDRPFCYGQIIWDNGPSDGPSLKPPSGKGAGGEASTDQLSVHLISGTGGGGGGIGLWRASS